MGEIFQGINTFPKSVHNLLIWNQVKELPIPTTWEELIPEVGFQECFGMEDHYLHPKPKEGIIPFLTQPKENFKGLSKEPGIIKEVPN